MTTTELFFALVGFSICGKPLSEQVKSVLTEREDAYASLFTLSKNHDLAHLLCEALEKNGLLPDNQIGEAFRQQRLTAIFRYEQIHYDYEQLCQALEGAGIDFMPLKGSVLRDLYPEPWLRTSCDIDVLVHKSDLEKASDVFRKDLHYQEGVKGVQDYSFWSEEEVHVELHFDLIEYVPKHDPVLANTWTTSLLKTGTNHHRLMTDETFYFYHIGHMAKHVVNGGCGFRSFIDLWILDHLVSHDQEKRDELLRQGGLLTFANAARKLVAVWFEDAEKDELSEKLEKFLWQGGSYGSLETQVVMQQAKKGGRVRYFFSLVWLPYDKLKLIYPKLETRKWAFPFYQIRRWFKILFKGVRSNTKEKLKTSNSITKEQRQDVANLLHELDL